MNLNSIISKNSGLTTVSAVVAGTTTYYLGNKLINWWNKDKKGENQGPWQKTFICAATALATLATAAVTANYLEMISLKQISATIKNGLSSKIPFLFGSSAASSATDTTTTNTTTETLYVLTPLKANSKSTQEQPVTTITGISTQTTEEELITTEERDDDNISPFLARNHYEVEE